MDLFPLEKLSFSRMVVFSVGVLCSLFCTTEAVAKYLPPNRTVPAIIVFGDSIVDPGNNNDLSTVIKANFAPYGKNFQGGKPTGRFCNGKVPSDLIAGDLGIRDTIPAYLDPNLQPNDLITGVSFASGGSGFDPLTPKLASVLSLSQQLVYYKEYINKLKGIVGEERTKFIIANAVYLVVAGSDDIANTYFVLRARQLQYDIPGYAKLMASKASGFLKEIYDLGVRRVAVFSAPPIGCVPSQRTLAGGIVRDCADNYNVAAKLFNARVEKWIDSFNADHPDSRVVYIDDYNTLLDIILNPKNYGFEVANKGCCGTGALEVAILCNPLTPTTCPDPSTYVFWDSYHPTERAYRILIDQLLPKYINQLLR